MINKKFFYNLDKSDLDITKQKEKELLLLKSMECKILNLREELIHKKKIIKRYENIIGLPVYKLEYEKDKKIFVDFTINLGLLLFFLVSLGFNIYCLFKI
ncbi:MAG: hypothetical protein LBF97_03335 [Elusimicrobiota bacterium]|jgi:hypothetical protein|nr:hypothetical protein [Elusimicrobiota bacterium]